MLFGVTDHINYQQPKTLYMFVEFQQTGTLEITGLNTIKDNIQVNNYLDSTDKWSIK